MRIPHHRLSAMALRSVVEEYVTRDGTDHSREDLRVEAVLKQLDAGTAELHYDPNTKSCNIVPSGEGMDLNEGDAFSD